MLWIKEVEMVESVDDLKSSRPVRGIQMPNFEVLDAKIASGLNRIIQNTRFRKKASLACRTSPLDVLSPPSTTITPFSSVCWGILASQLVVTFLRHAQILTDYPVSIACECSSIKENQMLSINNIKQDHFRNTESHEFKNQAWNV